VGGVLGTTLTGVFVASSLGGAGLAEGVSMGGQVFTQLIGVAATLAWTAIVTFVILKVIDAVVGLRVSEEEEVDGLDISQHEERAYNS
jgi:Amt family ammonium transporter